MKAFKLFVCGLLLASTSVYAADNKQSVKAPTVQKGQQSQTEKPKQPAYTWQDCVDDYTQESGYSEERAYKECNNLK
ncbi:MAG: hypothetical protein ACWGOV_04525 [Acidiferrobacterales bacterium]